MVVQCDFFNAKVSQYCYYEINMQRIRLKLSETQKNILRKESSLAGIAPDHEHTFWCKQMIHSVLLRQLKEDEESQKDGSLYFNFADKKVKFGRKKFTLITGLKMGDFTSEYVKFQTPDDPSLISKYLTGEGRHNETTYADIFKAYNQINASYSDEVVASLTLLLLYTSIIGEQKRNHIDDKVVHLACNWRKFDEIPWGEESFWVTVDSARKAIANALKQSRDQDNRTYTVGGFSVALRVFAYELMSHFTLVQKVEISGCIPRMFKWKAVKSHRSTQEKNVVWSKKPLSGKL